MFESISLLFVLLNPFLLGLYLQDIIRELSFRTFAGVVLRASLISGTVFVAFGISGDRIFSDLFHVRFAAFQIFGGIVFLLIGIHYVLYGGRALKTWRGDPDYLAGTVAMPFMIGPGTISASVIIGAQMSMQSTIISIATAVFLAAVAIILLKYIHDVLKKKKEALVYRYIEVTGRIMSLFVGTYAIEMILQGLEAWLKP